MSDSVPTFQKTINIPSIQSEGSYGPPPFGDFIYIRSGVIEGTRKNIPIKVSSKPSWITDFKIVEENLNSLASFNYICYLYTIEYNNSTTERSGTIILSQEVENKEPDCSIQITQLSGELINFSFYNIKNGEEEYSKVVTDKSVPITVTIYLDYSRMNGKWNSINRSTTVTIEESSKESDVYYSSISGQDRIIKSQITKIEPSNYKNYKFNYSSEPTIFV